MNKPYPEWYRDPDYIEAREEFIRRRTEEMKEIASANQTINTLMSSPRLQDEVEAALAKCLYSSHNMLTNTLDSCIRELARIEFEEDLSD